MKLFAIIPGSGSAPSNSFATIQAPNGTNPVASSPTDTLTFTSSDSSITITGNSGTKTIDFMGASSGYSRIQEEGATLTARSVLNFIGTAITAADSSSPARTDVTIAQVPSGSTQLVGGGRNITPVFPLLGGGNLYTDVTLSIPIGTGSTGGYISAADWTTFNAKVATTRTIGTTFPLLGGGDLSADRVISITMTPAGSTLGVGSNRNIGTTFPLTGGGDLSADRVLAMPIANGTTGGYLSATDWTTFNSKVATTRSVGTTFPMFGGGDLSADRVLGMNPATGLTAGFMSTAGQTLSGLKTFGSGWAAYSYTVRNPVVVADGATLIIDASLGNHFGVTLGGNRNLAGITNAIDGQYIVLQFGQDATGSRTITMDPKWKLGSDIFSVVLSTVPNSTDFMGGIYRSVSTMVYVTAFDRGY